MKCSSGRTEQSHFQGLPAIVIVFRKRSFGMNFHVTSLRRIFSICRFFMAGRPCSRSSGNSSIGFPDSDSKSRFLKLLQMRQKKRYTTEKAAGFTKNFKTQFHPSRVNPQWSSGGSTPLFTP